VSALCVHKFIHFSGLTANKGHPTSIGPGRGIGVGRDGREEVEMKRKCRRGNR
jgi:hypothetical protein